MPEIQPVVTIQVDRDDDSGELTVQDEAAVREFVSDLLAALQLQAPDGFSMGEPVVDLMPTAGGSVDSEEERRRKAVKLLNEMLKLDPAAVNSFFGVDRAAVVNDELAGRFGLRSTGTLGPLGYGWIVGTIRMLEIFLGVGDAFEIGMDVDYSNGETRRFEVVPATAGPGQRRRDR